MGAEQADRVARPWSPGLDETVEALAPALLAYADRRFPIWARRRADPEDLVQDAYLALWSRREWIEVVSERTVRAYLFTSLRNRARDEVRRARLVEVAADPMESASDDPDPEEQLASRQRRAHLRRALEILSHRDRELAVGRLVLGLPFRQLARLGTLPNANSARQAFLRALRKLQERLAGASGPLPSAAKP